MVVTVAPVSVTTDYSKVAGYKINIQKSIAFLYMNNRQIEIELKNVISFTIATKSIRNLGLHLTKEVKDLHKESYEKLKKEIGNDTKKWKDVPCS